jgi:predicted ester cyclase
MGIRDLFSRVGGGHQPGTTDPDDGRAGDDEPIRGYDRTDAKDLIGRLHEHSQAELEEIEAYERSHGNRTRVLNKLHYLRQREPLPGYDDLSVEEIAAALENADLVTIKHVRAYERTFHNRPNVQEAVEVARRRRESGEAPPSGTGYHATSYGPSVAAARTPGPGRLAANKTVTSSYYDEVMNRHDLGSIDRLLSEGFIFNGEVRGPGGQRAAVADLLAAFPDLQVETELILAEGDLVSVHTRWTGTHRGAVPGVEPTGRRVELTSTAIHRVHDDLITEAWDELDLAGLLGRLSPMRTAT